MPVSTADEQINRPLQTSLCSPPPDAPLLHGTCSEARRYSQENEFVKINAGISYFPIDLLAEPHALYRVSGAKARQFSCCYGLMK